MARPIPNNSSITKTKVYLGQASAAQGTNRFVRQAPPTEDPTSIRRRQIEGYTLLARLFSGLSLAWRWGLLGLSMFLGLSLIWYAFHHFEGAIKFYEPGILIVAGGLGLLLILMALYVIFQSAGLRQLESASSDVQVAALLNFVTGAVTLVVLVTTAALTLAIVALVSITIRVLFHNSGDSRREE